MIKKSKYYVVWEGHKKGIFESWEECQIQIKDFPKPQYKSFESKKEAEIAFTKKYWDYVEKKNDPKKTENYTIIYPSICVDAACSGNPGDLEYRGVDAKSGRELFKMGVFKEGTNNIGEFLAIVHGLALLKKNNSNIPIYSDSQTAIAWVTNKKAKTKLELSAANKLLFELIERAEKWLENNHYTNKIIKWETKEWGEIPADFGRK